ncbi:hypothetical protein ACQKDD_13430 [Planococcus kocurii]|uniref:Uncharacterized protein n=1 Tax=Planococcus kocurii TaxID=1374 RepID=A0ABM5WWM0_9BACL|nr:MULTISPECIES: hypothetical protein [Planococcus]ALS78739.1 hypothetical protein AUO94_08760 [Planococcus kocurii]KAA0955184.1 hypothetical protein FQ085_16045 [Planococcus sp. ANT_H30]
MQYVLSTVITILLAIIGFFASVTLLIFTVGDSDIVILYSLAIVIGVLLVVVINQLIRLNKRLERSQNKFL